MTRAAVAGPVDGFVSLREHLIDQGLREFTDAELAEIIADSLEYEPEDDLIVDPYMTAILNGEREVQVGDKICRFVDEGMVMYDVADKEKFKVQDIDLALKKVDVNAMEEGQTAKLQGADMNAELVKIDYIASRKIDDTNLHFIRDDGKLVEVGGSSGGSSSGSSGGSASEYHMNENPDTRIFLVGGIQIPANKIRRATYKKGGGNGSWLAKGASGLLGTNVTITNNYDKRHRMKLRMYEQNYVIHRAVGMTVRMQTRRFRIWWRKKAQEFRYGWSAIECEYDMKTPTFQPPQMPGGVTPEYSRIPTAMTKKFPFANSKIILFNVPIANYDVTTGTINSVFAKGVNAIAKNMKKWFDAPENKNTKKYPRGIFTEVDSKTIRVIYPQGEEKDWNTGREVVKWDAEWFSGDFSVGFAYNSPGGGFKFGSLDVKAAKKVHIVRGQIYGAVKYRNEWRACVIATE